MFMSDRVEITAPPDCEAAAQAFFGELLGFSRQAQPHTWRTGFDIEVCLDIREDYAPPRGAPVLIGVPSAAALEGLAVRLQAAGYPVERDPRPWVSHLTTTDPWGGRLALMFAP